MLRLASRTAFLLTLAVAVGLGSAWVLRYLEDDAEAAQIPVREENVVLGTARSEDEALAIASDKLGFSVRALGTLPEPRLVLDHINVDRGPDVPNAVPAAILIYRPRPDEKTEEFTFIAVTEVNVRTEEPAHHDPDPAKNPTKRVDVGRTDIEGRGAEVGSGRVIYTVWTESRTFYVVVDGTRTLTSDELSEMFSGLVG